MFNKEWTNKYFFGNAWNKAVFIVSWNDSHIKGVQHTKFGCKLSR